MVWSNLTMSYIDKLQKLKLAASAKLMTAQSRSSNEETDLAEEYRRDSHKTFKTQVLGQSTDDDTMQKTITETINLGDVTNHIYPGSGPEASIPVPELQEARKPKKLLKTAVIVGATLLGGAGAGTLTNFALNRLGDSEDTPPNPRVVTTKPATDADTQYEVGFGQFVDE